MARSGPGGGWRTRVATAARTTATFTTIAGGVVVLTTIARQLADDRPLQPSLTGATWAFLVYWCVLVALNVVVRAPSYPRVAREVATFFATDYDDADRAGLAAVMGPATRWRRRVASVGASAFIIGVAALLSTLWGTTPGGVWATLRDPHTVSPDVLPYLGRVWPVLLWWMVASALVCWACLGLLGLGFPTIPGRFHYRVRSARLGRAIAVGLRSGLSVLAYVVQFAPVFLLGYVALRANPSSAALVDEFVPRSARAAAHAGIGAIADHPVLSAVLLGALPLVVLALPDRALARWTALDARDWSLATDIPPVLYLRTWEADRTVLPAGGLRRGVLEYVAPQRTISFAELVGAGLEPMAPVIATAEPGSRRLAGVGSMWSSDQEWRENVRLRAADSLCVVLTADTLIPETGFSWEVDMIGSGAVTDRVAIVLPPGTTVADAQRPGGFLYEIALQPLFRGLGMADLPDDTLVLVRDAAGAWHPYGASARTALCYYLCIMDAVDQCRDDWAASARTSSGPASGGLEEVSEDRFALEGMLDQAPLGTIRLRLFHRVSTSRLGRRYLTWLESLDD